jgi:DNA-binding NarL/FixJ family response regulator
LSSPDALRVLIADDHPVVLAGVRALLKGDPDIEIVGEALNGHAALRMATELEPSIVLLDLSMPGLDGVEVTQQLLTRRPDCKVVVLTVHEDRSYLRKLIEVGAAGYVLKRSAAKVLLHAIHAVAAGGIYLDPLVAVHALDRAPKKPKESAEGHLSEREIQVLPLVAAGHSNKEIANILYIGVKSVETYKRRAMQKLGFQSRAELVRYAANKGWLTEH